MTDYDGLGAHLTACRLRLSRVRDCIVLDS